MPFPVKIPTETIIAEWKSWFSGFAVFENVTPERRR